MQLADPSRARHLLRLAVVLTVGIAPSFAIAAETAKRPNILWFVVDDMSANFSCYGEQAIQTPHVDRLAREGTMFRSAFVTAPVCSPCRSALITGMYQTSIGSHQHRSGRGALKIHLPEGVRPIPLLFQQAGYYTCIGDGQENSPGKRGRLGKTDYNFEWPAEMYDGRDWSGRKPGQPFFMQVQLAGGKYRNGGSWPYVERQLGADLTKPEDVREIPAYYPRDPEILKDWARYLDTVRVTDREVGAVLARLEREKLYENTLIIFMTDHGISHARGKQFLYNEGTHVPFVVRGPGIPSGKERRDLIEHIDMAAISLAATGIEVPRSMQARDVFATDYQPREAVFAARDRCDETVERIRSLRTDRFLYIRNFYPERPPLQPNRYKDAKPTLIRLRQLHDEHKLPELTERLLFAPTRPAEELYDWTRDRWQVHNLADDPSHLKTLQDLRSGLDRWMRETNDHGPESEAMYDSDMKVYVAERPDSTLEKNIALMKRWARQGK